MGPPHDAPDGTPLSTVRQEVARLGPQQLQALRDRLREAKKSKARKPEAPRIPRLRRQGRKVFPASFAQRRLWLHHQLDPESIEYNLMSLIPVEDHFHRPTLEATVARLMEHHEVFRTTFAWIDGEVCQVLREAHPVAVPLVDLSAIDEGETIDDIVRAAIDGGLSRPFDLARGPMLRAVVLWQAPREYLVLLFYHHIISDLWSQRLIPKIFEAFYRRLRRHRPLRLKEERLQYADYAAWQVEQYSGALEEEHLAYWRARLGERPPPLELPTDRPRSPEPPTAASRVSRRLEAVVLRPLLAIGREEGATTMMVGLAIFKLLLYTQTGQRIIRVGAPVANRDREEVQDMLGFFVNLVLFSSDVLAAPEGRPGTFRDLLREVRQTCLGALRHQGFPYERLVELLGARRDPGRLPLIEAMYNFLPGKIPGMEFEAKETGLDLVPGSLRANSDLSLILQEKAWGWLIDLEYPSALFDRTSIERLLRRFSNIVEKVSGSPSQPLDLFSWLSAVERHQVLEEWSGERRGEPPAPAFEEIVAELRARAYGEGDGRPPKSPPGAAPAVGSHRLSRLLEETFGIPFAPQRLRELTTLDALCEHILHLLEEGVRKPYESRSS